MKFKDEEAWKKGKKVNEDPYGSAIYKYAESWADLMEIKIAEGLTIVECANETSHEADTEGITGFMYGAAIAILSVCWKHGEELRRWHNLDCQTGNEGERANKKGTVLNPAVIEIMKGGE